MPTYVEYKNEDGTSLLIEMEPTGPVTRSNRGGVDVIQTGRNFMDALASIRGSMQALTAELDLLKVDEATVVFGLKAVGEVGNIAIGKMGGEINYQVTLKWKKQAEDTDTASVQGTRNFQKSES